MKSHIKLPLNFQHLAAAATTTFILMILMIHQVVHSAAATTNLIGQQQQQLRQRVAPTTTNQQQQLQLSVDKPLATDSHQHRRQGAASEQEMSSPSSSGHQLIDQMSLNRLTENDDHHERQQQENHSSLANLESSALNYLQKYGYMSAPTNGGETNNLISEESFSGAISDFQRFAGLAPSGVVDKETLELMKLPRCGNSDKWQHQQAHDKSILNNPIMTGQDRSSPSSSMIVRPPAQPTVNKIGQLNQTRSRLASLRRRRRKRYALQGSKWRRQELTYRISQYPTRFNGKRHEVDAQIAKAFGIWSQVAPIDFVVKKEGRVHIDIRFASGDHGDGDAFDGPGNTLAHAYFPQYGGDAHFDDQEFWTIDSYAGTNIFQVAAHELGHSLGLGHSNVREALMAPFYQKYKPNFRLHMDDVLAIQALYGEKSLQVPSIDLDGSSNSLNPYDSPSTRKPPPPPSTTSTTSTTTTSTTTTGRPKYPIYRGLKPLYPFGGGDAPRRPGLPPPGEETNPPVDRPVEEGAGGVHDKEDPSDHESPAGSNFPDLSTNGIGDEAGGGQIGAADLCLDSSINAATRTEDGNSYVFKGDHYWLLTQEGVARGYPRRISADWDGLPGKLDAALTWADGKTFFFKGNKYWRFRNKRRDVGYPKLISAGFAGIPDDIDAAFVWSGNGRTYIFKGAEYWRFDSKSDPPVSAEYPRPIKVWSGVPAHLDAAFKWENNVTYFFKGNQYYRFNDREFKVETKGRPAFPRQTSEWWFGCLNANLAAQRAPLSSSLRESRTMSNEIESSAAQASFNVDSSTTTQLNEWSFLAGLEENTRLMGTHISDRRSPPTLPTQSSSNETAPDEANIGQHSHDINRNQINHRRSSSGQQQPPSFSSNEHFRLGILEPQHSLGSAALASSSASSAILLMNDTNSKLHHLTITIQTILSILILLANMRPMKIAFITS